MMSKEAKKNYVEEMKKNFTDNESVMIAQYQGLNVNELDSLRKELREKGILPTPKAETFSNFLDNFIAENTPRGDAIPIDKKGWPIPFGPSEFPKA